MSKSKALFIFVLLLPCVGSNGSARRIAAQERATTTTTTTTPDRPTAPASLTPQGNARPQVSSKPNDLEITANVTARELRFEVVPNPKVEFSGQPERDTVWEAERQNLPRPVEPGVTYRNIGIQLKITSVFADIDRIVAEALGETPVTDDVPKEKAAPQPPPAAAPTAPPSLTRGGKP